MRIRIVSPSGAVEPNYIDGAQQVLEQWGHEVSIGIHAKGRFAGFAGTREERLSDLNEAYDDPQVDAILCSRGGYGLAQIIDKVNINPQKLLIGYSDITCLHCLYGMNEATSLHSIMAKHIATLHEDSEPMQFLRAILDGKRRFSYQLPTNELSRLGSAQGILRGGNLSVLYGLQGTPYQIKADNAILFIEDIGEPQHQIDRILQSLRMSRVFDKINGLIVGQFTDCADDDRLGCTLKQAILNAVSEYSFPVVMDFPAGHVEYNLPLLMNTKCELQVTRQLTQLSFI